MIYFKNNVVAIVSLLLSFNVFAQTTRIPVALKWGKEHDAIEALAVSQSIGFDKVNLYTVEWDYKYLKFPNFYLLKYDVGFTQINKTKIETKQGEKEYEFEGFNMIKNGDLYLLSSYADKIQKRNTLYAQSIDKESLKPKGDFNKIVEVPFESKYKYDIFPLGLGFAVHRNTGSFHIFYSSDSSKLVVIAKTDLKAKADETFCISVLDQNMKVLWSKIVVLPYTNKLFDVLNFDVSNDGDVYIVGKLYNEKRKEKVKEKPNYKYQLLHYNATTENDNIIDIDIKDVFINDLKVSVNKNNDVICAGFYSKKGIETVLGTYLTIVDGKTKKIKSEFQQKFDFDFVTEKMTDSEIKKAKKLEAEGEETEMKHFVIRDIIRKNDGGYILTAEQFLDTKANTLNATYTQIYYDDILIVSISKAGGIEWKTKIPKRQFTSAESDNMVSFATVFMNDKLYILFNESNSNITKNRFAKTNDLNLYSAMSKQVQILFCFDMEGNRSSKVFKHKGDGFFVNPKSIKRFNGDKILVLGKYVGRQKFGQLVFGEKEKDE
jgi:hypothetical protein